MQVISLSDNTEPNFARKAIQHFLEHPTHYTFTADVIEYGELFAVRWGADQDCVVVFEIGSSPKLYTP